MIIKAISPLFRYDGEPSVSNGITYPTFLRPTCSYTECQLSFLTGVYALWSKLLPATALVYL